MWRKAQASTNNGACVEVRLDPDNCSQCHNTPPGLLVLVRDSKDPDGPHLHFTGAEWTAFLEGVASGEFTLEALSA